MRLKWTSSKGKTQMKVSIIIINYNYGRYLQESIESCLNQSYENKEVIVVDDGSTDDSRKTIVRYGKSVKKIFQAKSGMVEASNAGFAESTGNIVIFLDADDYLMSNAVSVIVKKWQHGISKIHFRLQVIDRYGREIGFFPALHTRLSEGEVWKEIVNTGTNISPPTGGHAFSRHVLKKMFPVKDAKIGNSGSYYDVIPTDAYLKERVPFYGPVIAIQEPLSVRRIHGLNNGGDQPYFNQPKRQRILNLTKMNSVFIKKRLQKKNIDWNEHKLFRYSTHMKLRILSYRFDGVAHLWKDDSRTKLLSMGFSNLRLLPPSRFFKEIYRLTVILLLLVLPQKFVILLLRRIHPKRLRSS